MPKKLFLLASLLLATACTGGTGDRSEIRTLSNGETLPAECDICWVDFEACADSGVSIELCEQAVIGCAEICEAPLPPVQCDHCFAGYEACVDEAAEGMQDAGDCVAGLESCLGSCEDPNPCMPGDDCCGLTSDGLPGGECPPSSCEDVCISDCYYDVKPTDGMDSDIPPVDGCFESCMTGCEPPPEPCAEVCWSCDEMDQNCIPGCDWVCEPPPMPCVEECWECPADAENCVSGCSTVCKPEPPPEPCTVICPDCPQDAECKCEVICEPQPEPPPCTGGCEQVCDQDGNCETICWDSCDGGTEPPSPAPTPAD